MQDLPVPSHKLHYSLSWLFTLLVLSPDSAAGALRISELQIPNLQSQQQSTDHDNSAEEYILGKRVEEIPC